jgi:hypothetical protein
MKIGADGKPAELERDEAPEEARKKEAKLSFKEKLEHFWYFYKWQTIISIIVVFGIGLGLVQLFTNVSPDARIMYIGPGYLSPNVKTDMGKVAEQYLNDYNGDNKKYLGILDITAAVGDNIPQTAYELNTEAAKRFNVEITTGDSMIYLVEESFYIQLKDMGVLEKLSNLIDTDLLPDNTYDEYGVRVSNLDFFNLDGFSAVPDNTILCMRQSPVLEELSYGRTVEFWNSNKALFKAMFEYKGEKKPDSQPGRVFNVKGYDAVIMYIGYNRIYEITQKPLSKSASAYIYDSNKSNAKELGIDYRILQKSADKTAYQANPDDAAYLENQIANGNDILFLVERSFYDKLYESGVLLSVESVFTYRTPDGETVVALPDVKSFDGYGVDISELEFFSNIEGFDVFGEDLVLCIRNRPENCDKSYYNSCVEFYRNILNYTTKTPTAN